VGGSVKPMTSTNRHTTQSEQGTTEGSVLSRSAPFVTVPTRCHPIAPHPHPSGGGDSRPDRRLPRPEAVVPVDELLPDVDRLAGACREHVPPQQRVQHRLHAPWRRSMGDGGAGPQSGYPSSRHRTFQCGPSPSNPHRHHHLFQSWRNAIQPLASIAKERAAAHQDKKNIRHEGPLCFA